MAVDPQARAAILAAAAAVFRARGVAIASRHDVARAADVPLRTVTAVGPHRTDLLRLVVAEAPFPPVAELIRAQADAPVQPVLHALLTAARRILGDPAAAWDPVELQAIVHAPYDPALAEVVATRLNARWDAAHAVLQQLRGEDGSEPDLDAAVLHMVAVGLGLALLAPVAPRWSEPRAWTALSARMLETVVADTPVDEDGEDVLAWRVRIRVRATPAATARLLRALSVLRVTVVGLFTAEDEEGEQLVELFVHAPADVQRATLEHALSAVGVDVIVARGRSYDAMDIASRVLRLSAALATDPAAAPQGAAELVLADSWEVEDAAEGPDASPYVLRLQWTLERHVVLRRARAPFTRTEQNRASALLELVAALAEARGDVEGGFGWRVVLGDGSAVTVRLARPDDSEGVELMHQRSSPASRYQRYFTPMNEWRQENLRRISGEHRGSTLVVTDDAGAVIALGNVFPLGPTDSDSAEIALIVDDAWHGRGVGTVLTTHLVDVARRLGFSRLVAYVLAENRAMLRILESSGLTWHTVVDHDLGASVVCRAATIGSVSGARVRP